MTTYSKDQRVQFKTSGAQGGAVATAYGTVDVVSRGGRSVFVNWDDGGYSEVGTWNERLGEAPADMDAAWGRPSRIGESISKAEYERRKAAAAPEFDASQMIPDGAPMRFENRAPWA